MEPAQTLFVRTHSTSTQRFFSTFTVLLATLTLVLAACDGDDVPASVQAPPGTPTAHAPQTPTEGHPPSDADTPPTSPDQPAADAPPPPDAPDIDEPDVNEIPPAPGLDSAPPGLRIDLLIEITDPSDNQILLEIGQAVAKRRELPLLQEVPVYLIRRNDIVAYLESGLDDGDRRENLAFELSLRLLGLLDEDDDLSELQHDLFEGAVLGFYDPDIESFVIVSGNDGLSGRDLDTITHEFVHALQDQHFQIGETLERLSSNTDASLAFRFVVEGDATVAEGLFGDLITQFGPRLQAATDVLPGTRLTIPAIIQKIFFSPYIDGAFIVANLRNGPGVEAIDAILDNPADSTEQLLHSVDPHIDFPELVPIVLPEPDVRGALGGQWELLGHDTLGEFIITEYLDQAIPRPDAGVAGVGWGGDRLSVYAGPDDAALLAWHTAWDSEQDASEFFEMYAALMRETANDVVELAAGRIFSASDGDRSIWMARAGAEVWVVSDTDTAAAIRVQQALSTELGIVGWEPSEDDG